MGFRLFAPSTGLRLLANCVIAGTQVKDVVRPMTRCLAVLLAALILLMLAPSFSLWLPARLGL